MANNEKYRRDLLKRSQIISSLLRPNLNPSGDGARTLGAYINAIQSMKGEAGGDMDVAAAVDLIHNTPQSTRSRFAKEIWARRERRSSEVPF